MTTSPLSLYINDWPTNVLKNIFAAAQLHATGANVLCTIPKRFSHVCRHWRSITTNQPELWAIINTLSCNSEWLTEVLGRSRGENLFIDMVLDSSETCKKNLPMLLEHAKRFEGFQVEISEPDLPYLSELKCALRASLPKLKTIRWYERDGLSGSPPFQERDDFPALKALTFRQSIVPDLSSSLLQGLKRLRVDETTAPVTHWLTTLKPMVELEELALVNSMSSLFGSNPIRINLSKLKSLNIDEFWDSTVMFLTNLELPPLEVFRCFWRVRAPETEGMANQVQNALMPILDNWPQDDLRSTCLKVGSNEAAFYNMTSESRYENETADEDQADEDYDWEEDEDNENYEEEERGTFDVRIEVISPDTATFSMVVLTACAVRATTLDLQVEVGEIDDFILGLSQCLLTCVSLEVLIIDSLEVIASIFPLLVKAGVAGCPVFPRLAAIRFICVPEGSEALVPAWESILLAFLEWREESDQRVCVDLGNLKVSEELAAAVENSAGIK